MKYLITTVFGGQFAVESDKSLAHLTLDYSATTDIQPIREEVESEIAPTVTPAKKSVKKAKDAS